MTLLELQGVLPSDTKILLIERRESSCHIDNYVIAVTDKNLLQCSHYLNSTVVEVMPQVDDKGISYLSVFIKDNEPICV